MAGPSARLFWQVQGFSWSASRRLGSGLTYALPPQANSDNWVGECVLWISGGSGGQIAVEVVGAARWLDERIGKLDLKRGQNLVCRSVKTFETVHGKPFYTRAGLLLLAASWQNLALKFCVSCFRAMTYTGVQC